MTASDIVEPIRVEPGTYDAAADLAAMAQRLAIGGRDAAEIRQGIVSPDLAEFVQAVDDLRKPKEGQVLRALGDMHREASRKAGKSPLGMRWERAALYLANARTFWQAAKMNEVEGKNNAIS